MQGSAVSQLNDHEGLKFEQLWERQNIQLKKDPTQIAQLSGCIQLHEMKKRMMFLPSAKMNQQIWFCCGWML